MYKTTPRIVLHSAESLFTTANASILDVIRIIDAGAQKIAFMIDDARHLQGVVTDGDIRRAILRGIDLNANVSDIMNRNPTVYHINTTDTEIHRIFINKNRLDCLPVIDDQRQVVGFYSSADLTIPAYNFPVILMAGGLGSRLHPLTDNIPKPMIEIGGRPILEHIIKRFVRYGFNQFYISVNYLSHIIKNYFQDGVKFGVKIEYLEETERLGTAGCLRLISQNIEGPLFIMNGDILTTADFSAIAAFHLESGAMGTMCLRKYTVQVPYGVVEHAEGRLTRFQEKPSHHYFVNSGIYIIEKSVLSLLPTNAYFDMPALFDKLMEVNPKSASVFPIREYWRDIGNIADLEQARIDFSSLDLTP
ncbi:MAG: nucleotidyltransferase family protein [Phycisphaerae bacterium]|nr:nucleotidyltransferase family protein [Phycisphaerae bacterium]